MSAYPDDGEHFLKYAQSRDYSITGGSFVPRALYGEYLEQVLTEAQSGCTTGSSLEQLVVDVVDVALAPDGADAFFSDGRSRRFDRVVLAIGNYPPADPAVARRRVLDAPGYVRDPWAPRALEDVDPGEPVLLLGTGLTTLDVVLDLHQRGMRAPMIALSRRGLLPLPHRAATAAPSFTHRPPNILDVAPTAFEYLRSVRRYIDQLAPTGVDWREVLTSLRPITPALWGALSIEERARFLRHLRPFWEVHRHRAAPLPHGMFQRLIANGDLRVIAGRLDDLDTGPNGFTARIAQRGERAVTELCVASVVNCTGPQSDITRVDEPLLSNLLRRGYIRADPLSHGVDTAETLALIDHQGIASRALYYIGPLLRARLWEATAVPELRAYAADLARTLAEVG